MTGLLGGVGVMLWAQVAVAVVPSQMPVAFDVPAETSLSPAAVSLARELRTELLASGVQLSEDDPSACALALREVAPGWVQLTLRLGAELVAERRLALEDSARMRLGAWLFVRSALERLPRLASARTQPESPNEPPPDGFYLRPRAAGWYAQNARAQALFGVQADIAYVPVPAVELSLGVGYAMGRGVDALDLQLWRMVAAALVSPRAAAVGVTLDVEDKWSVHDGARARSWGVGAGLLARLKLPLAAGARLFADASVTYRGRRQAYVLGGRTVHELPLRSGLAFGVAW